MKSMIWSIFKPYLSKSSPSKLFTKERKKKLNCLNFSDYYSFENKVERKMKCQRSTPHIIIKNRNI